MKVCIVGASGKLGQYMVQHALDRGYEVVGVCREQSVEKLGRFRNRISIVHGATDDRDVIKRAVEGCDAVLTVLVPRGLHQYASGSAQSSARLCSARGAPRVLVRVARHTRRAGRVLAETQNDRERLRLGCETRSLCRPGRAGGGV